MPLTLTSGTSTNSSVWYGWTNATTSTYAITTTNTIWSAWNGSATTATTGTTGNLYTLNNALVWRSWNETGGVTGGVRNGLYVPAPETPEQRAAREEQRRRYEVEEQARRAVRAEADRRAEALLRAHLTPEQQASLSRDNWFLIDSASGKKYRINRGRSANIDVIDETGKTVRSLCVHPRDNVPDADTMLAQVLMLKYDEETLLRMANVHSANHGFRRGAVPGPIALPRAA